MPIEVLSDLMIVGFAMFTILKSIAPKSEERATDRRIKRWRVKKPESSLGAR
jgi:hypothetical protein